MKINPVNVNPITIPRHHQVVNKTASEAKIETGNSSANDITDESVKTNTAERIDDESVTEVDQTEEDKLLSKSVDQANQTLKMYDRKLEMSVHEVTKTIMYTLRDTKTNEVIMEFPPKKIQDMIAKMWELAGLFVDKKA